MALNIGELQQIGIALESVWGTSPGTFTKGIAVNSFTVNPAITSERVPEMDGSLIRARSSAGQIDFEVSFTFWLDPGDTTGASLGQFLASLFGDDAVTGATDPFTHTFKSQNNAEPPSFSIYRKTGTLTKVYTGFRAGSVKFTINAADARIGIEVTGRVKSEATIASQTLTFSDETLLVPSQAALSIDGSSDINFESIEVTFSRTLEGIHTVSASRNISFLSSGDMLVDIALNGIEPGDQVLRNKFLALHDASSERFDIDLNIIRSASRKIEIDIPKSVFATFEGPDVTEGLNRISATGFGLRDTGLQVLMVNAVAGAYDA